MILPLVNYSKIIKKLNGQYLYNIYIRTQEKMEMCIFNVWPLVRPGHATSENSNFIQPCEEIKAL